MQPFVETASLDWTRIIRVHKNHREHFALGTEHTTLGRRFTVVRVELPARARTLVVFLREERP